jgi:hypothetical protein
MDAGVLDRVSRCILPLRLIFWGGLLCLFDVTISNQSNGHGFLVDFLNDFVGMTLITIGVFKILGLRLGENRRWRLRFVAVVCIGSSAMALLNHFIFPRAELFFWAGSILCLAELAAILFFCAAMRSICRRAGAAGASASWKTTFFLFLFILVLPLGLLQLIGMIATLAGSSFNFPLGVAGILILAAFFIPFIHFFVSISRMKRAVRPLESEGAERAVLTEV